MKKRIAILLLMSAMLLLSACGIHQKLEKIDVAQAQEAAMSALGVMGDEMSYIAASLLERDGKSYYEVRITVDGTEHIFAVDAISGVIIEQTPAAEIASNKTSADTEGYIGEEKAYELAYTDAGYTAAHASLVSCKLEQTDAGYRYVVDFIGVNKNHRYEVDALTGEILKRSESTNKTPARNGDEIDPEMNVYPLNPAAEDSSMDVIQPPIDDSPVIDLTPAEVKYPILDLEKTELGEGTYHASDILQAITDHSGYTRKEIKVLARLFAPIQQQNACHVYFTTPDGKYFYYVISTKTLTVLRRETADDLNGLDHPLRDCATEVVVPQGMISIEEAYGYALKVNQRVDTQTKQVITVGKDDVILYVAEADFRNGEYEYDFIYQEKNSGRFDTVTVRASDGAIRLFGSGLWSKGYFGDGFVNLTAVKLNANEAKSMALSYVPGAGVTNIENFVTDTEGGKMEYRGEIVYGTMRYAFVIDGYSGAIRSWVSSPAGREK